MTEHNSCNSLVLEQQRQHAWLQLVEVLATRSWLRLCLALLLRFAYESCSPQFIPVYMVQGLLIVPLPGLCSCYREELLYL